MTITKSVHPDEFNRFRKRYLFFARRCGADRADHILVDRHKTRERPRRKFCGAHDRRAEHGRFYWRSHRAFHDIMTSFYNIASLCVL